MNRPDRTYCNAVSPGYFAAIGPPIAAGRDFAWSDREDAPPVVIIDASLARVSLGNESPIGRTSLMGRNATEIGPTSLGIILGEYHRAWSVHWASGFPGTLPE